MSSPKVGQEEGGAKSTIKGQEKGPQKAQALTPQTRVKVQKTAELPASLASLKDLIAKPLEGELSTGSDAPEVHEDLGPRHSGWIRIASSRP